MRRCLLALAVVLLLIGSADAERRRILSPCYWDSAGDNIVCPGDISISGAATIGTTGVGADRAVTKLSLTADTALTEAQILANYWISNQGDDGEQDDTLPAVSYPISVCFTVEEAQIIEVNPPSGELFDLDGTALDADDCIDSPATVGSKMVCTRMQIADASWRWSCDTVRGVWVDAGASD